MEPKRTWSGMICLLGMLLALAGLGEVQGGTCTIEGYLFDDLNQNSNWDSDEPGIAEEYIYLSLNNKHLGTDVISVLTDPNGFYRAENIESPATYCVWLMESIYPQTFPVDPNYYTIQAESGQVYSNINFGRYEPNSIQVSMPTISPVSGLFTGSVEVTLSCSTIGASIYYTTDDSTPTAASMVYTGPFSVIVPCTVKARACKAGFIDSEIAGVDYQAPLVSKPTISPSGGAFAGPVEVILYCATEGAAIYYTTDPNASPVLYVSPVTVISPCTITAQAFKVGYAKSNIASATYTLPQVSMPTISPGTGAYTSSFQVTLSCSTAGAIIYYTTDGSTPTTASTLYNLPFTVTAPCTVKARAFKSGYIDSSTALATYTFTSTQVSTPTISPNGGAFPGPVAVSISCVTEGAAIYYTTNGSVPTTASALYVSPITVTPPCSVRACAFKSGYTSSTMATANFTFLQVAAPTILPVGGVFTSPVNVTLSCATQGAAIYYTTNDSEPALDSTLYRTPFTVTPPCTVRVLAFKEGYAKNTASTVYGLPGYGGGTGTAADPYQIWTCWQLNNIGANTADWSKCFILMADIDMSAYTGTQYKIIGNTYPYFTGTLDGNGHIIRNLTYTTTAATNCVGLFGVISGAMIKNLGIENVNLLSGGKSGGGLAGSASGNRSIIINCYTTGQVNGTGTGDSWNRNSIGGLVGSNSFGMISDSYSTCRVNSKGYGVGGLVGFNTGSGTIGGCYSTGVVSGDSCVGGLVGGNGDTQSAGGTIMGCYSTGAVNGTGSYVGGLVGANFTAGTIKKCYSTGNISGSGSYIGGLVGGNDSGNNSSYGVAEASISNCYSTGGVSATDSCSFVGGFVGDNGGIIKTSCSTGNVDAPTSRLVGGLAGRNYGGTIADCYSSGNVGGGDYVSGLVGGANTCSVLNCYSTGAVSSRSLSVAGFLVPLNTANLVVKNCFWDMETSEKTIGGIAGATGKTTAEMKTLATFTEPASWWVTGQTGNALSFDGSVGYVEVPDYYGISGSNSRTVAMWIKASSSTANQWLIWWGMKPGKGENWLMAILSSGKITTKGVTGSKIVTDGQWHHIAVVLLQGQNNACQALLYVDGQLDATGSGSINTSQGEPVQLGVGINPSSLSYYYAGLMDDVRIYDRGLDAGEILPGSLPVNGLVAHWAMDETQGAVAHDSASGYDGRLRNIGWSFEEIDGDLADWYMPANDYPRLNWNNQVLVPDITAMTQAEAQSAITSSELFVGIVTTAYHGSVPAGRVISQSHPVGESVLVGTAISFVVSLGVDPTYGGGSGTTASPYQIWTAEQMNTIGAHPAHWSKSFILMADIDMSIYTGTQYNIIGNSTVKFTGIFDGNDHVIYNLTYVTTGANYYVGLFGYIDSLVIVKNLGLQNVHISSNGSYVGGMAGYSAGTIVNCHSTGNVVCGGDNCAGGLVGYNTGAITYCYSSSAISGHSQVGDLIGLNGGNVSFCYVTGPVSSEYSDVGGLVGSNNYGGNISNCYAINTVKGRVNVGGIAGVNDTSSLISNCYATGSVSGSSNSSNVGGLVGQNYSGTISYCYAAGAVSGSSKIGGLVGYNPSGTITNCFWDTQTTGCMTSEGGVGKTTLEMKTQSTFAGWDFVNETTDGMEDIWFIREGQEYPRLMWEVQQEITDSRDGLIPLGFVTISKTRVGRTAFEYELGVTVQNSNSFDMTNVQLQLVEWDTAVQSVSDDSLAIDTIPAGATVTSTDTFKIVVDRSMLINTSRLTWKLTYYTPGGQVQQAMMSMSLSAIDAVAGDITGDGKVNLEDFVVMSGQWNTVPGNPSADIALPLDGYVGIEDLIYLAENWLK